MRTLQEIFDFASNKLHTNGNPYGSSAMRKWSNINPLNFSERCILAQMVSTNLEVISIDFPELVKEVIGKKCGTGSKEYQFCVELAKAFDFWELTNNRETILKDIAKRYKLKYTTPPRKPIPQREPIETPMEEVV